MLSDFSNQNIEFIFLSYFKLHMQSQTSNYQYNQQNNSAYTQVPRQPAGRRSLEEIRDEN